MPRYSGYQSGAMVTNREEQRRDRALVLLLLAVLAMVGVGSYVLSSAIGLVSTKRRPG